MSHETEIAQEECLNSEKSSPAEDDNYTLLYLT